MSEAKPTLAEQVKAAERDKLIAEKEKIQYDLEQSKKLFTKNNFWTLIVAVAVFGFYYDFAAKPIIERDNINSSLDNAHQRVLIDTSFNRLIRRDLRVKKDSIKYDSLLTNFNISNQRNNSLSKQNLQLNTEVNSKKAEIENFNHTLTSLQKQKLTLVPLIDSLKNEVLINTVENKIRVDFILSYNNEIIYYLHPIVKTATNWNGTNKPVEFHPTYNYRWATQMQLFRGCKFILELRDKKFKLPNNIYSFETSSDSDLPVQKFEIPLELK